MFWEPFVALVSLDLAWIVNFLLANIFWVFAFYAIAYYFFGPKYAALNALLVAAYCWVSNDFAGLAGWTVLAAGFLSISYLSRLALVTFVEKTEAIRKYTPISFIAAFFITMIIYNLFLR